jgi:hypothetical protein
MAQRTAHLSVFGGFDLMSGLSLGKHTGIVGSSNICVVEDGFSVG